MTAAPPTLPTGPSTPEEAYELHRATLPEDNGALPWAEAGWGLRDHWTASFHARSVS